MKKVRVKSRTTQQKTKERRQNNQQTITLAMETGRTQCVSERIPNAVDGRNIASETISFVVRIFEITSQLNLGVPPMPPHSQC